MSYIDERAELHRARMKMNALDKVFLEMKKHRITVQDLVDYVPVSNREKLTLSRDLVSKKLRATESLRKARLAKEAKK